jgi:RNA polymerase sigma-70 factor (ECF subfamily)
VRQGEITRMLNGPAPDRERAAEMVYAELRRMAAKLMSIERRDHTLQPTILASEAYLALTGQPDQIWENRAHFFAVAARAMRRVLVDYSRRKRASRRGGELQRVPLQDLPNLMVGDPEELLAIDEVLTQLELLDSRQSAIVELRYFGGHTEEEIAELLGVSVRTVKRDWSVARAWLYDALCGRTPRSH